MPEVKSADRPPTRDDFLKLQSVAVRYGDVPAVEDVTFAVKEGAFVTLLGPSGSGKTSLLRAIAGFVPLAGGNITLADQRLNDVAPFRRDIGMVFQDYALFPHMTVAQNVGFGLEMRRVAKHDRQRQIAEALALVRLDEYSARYPSELSGGQQQRVAIARAIVIRPHLLLLDEPMSNLDALLRAAMQMELLDILATVGITTVSVTHNQEEALSMSDQIVVLANGRVQQIGSPFDVYVQPANEFVAGFVGQSNLIRCRVVTTNGAASEATTDFGDKVVVAGTRVPPHGELLLLVRPELIELGKQKQTTNSYAGRITQVMYLGANLQYRVRVGTRDFIAHQPARPGQASYALGEDVMLGWKPDMAVQLKV